MANPAAVIASTKRRRTKLGRLGDVPSDTYTTFVSATYTPTADGSTPTTLTFTAKDDTDTALEGVVVTYA